MDISINKQPADITLESEKTLGEVLSGIELWLQDTKNRISGLHINGKPINVLALPEALHQDLKTIQSLDITISTWQDLALEALFNLREDLKEYERSSFDRREHIKNTWETDVTAHFLAEQIPDIFILAQKTFSGEGFTPEDLGKLTEERIRELLDPPSEIKHISTLISEIALRLEDLPLDIQTGKDGRAAETIELFSHVTDKLFRLIHFLKIQGYPLDAVAIEDLPLDRFLDAFSTALRDLLGAYEAQDAVLVGDLAEYELAPRLLKLYSALREDAILKIG